MNALIARSRPAAAWQILDEIFAPARPGAPRPIPMDFYESEKEYLARAALPGFSKKQISIEIEGHVLTVTARRDASDAPEGFEPLRGEILPRSSRAA